MSPIAELDEDNAFEDASLRYELRHYFRVMGIFGLYFTPKKWQENSCTWIRPFLYKIHRLYCFIVQIILWFNVIRIVVGFWIDEQQYRQQNYIFLKVTFALWNMQSAVSGSIWFWLCCTDKLPNILHMWQTYCQSSPESRYFQMVLPSKCIRAAARAVLAIALSTIMLNLSLVAFVTFGPIEHLRRDARLFAFTPFSFDVVKWIGLYAPLYVFTNAALVFPVAFFGIFCMLLIYQYKQLTSFFVRSIDQNGNFTKSILTLRRQHQYIEGCISFR